MRLALEGTRSNRDAVGAQVRAYTSNGVQVRTVRGGSGFCPKNLIDSLYFGLGKISKIDRIEINWPSGHRQIIEEPAINQEHHITETF